MAAGYARMVSRNVLTMRALLQELLRGHLSDRLVEIALKHIMMTVEEQSGAVKPFALMMLGSDEYESIKHAVGERTVGLMPHLLSNAESYMEQALDLERTIQIKMAALTPDRFTGILRPVFQEDEWKLILLGGLLGAFIGAIQTIILGH